MGIGRGPRAEGIASSPNTILCSKSGKQPTFPSMRVGNSLMIREFFISVEMVSTAALCMPRTVRFLPSITNFSSSIVSKPHVAMSMSFRTKKLIVLLTSL